METEQRIQALEKDVKTLKIEIRRTLGEIRQNLSEASPPPRWHKIAWFLALINLLGALALTSNVFQYVPGYVPGYVPLVLDADLAQSLREFWVALVFAWILFQLYPLAMQLVQENRPQRSALWHRATVFLHMPSVLIFAMTLAVLIMAIINAFFPRAWLWVGLSLFIAIGIVAIRRAFEEFAKQLRA